MKHADTRLGVVDLERFMGRWYVLACIPTPFERGIRDAVETYRLDADGSIATTFRYRRRHPSNRIRTLSMRGVVDDRDTNAVWNMRLLWPFSAEYRIMAVDAGYSRAVIGRNRRDYAWILSRTPEMSHRHFFASVRVLRENGYDADRLQRIPHAPDAVAGLGEGSGARVVARSAAGRAPGALERRWDTRLPVTPLARSVSSGP